MYKEISERKFDCEQHFPCENTRCAYQTPPFQKAIAVSKRPRKRTTVFIWVN